METIPHKIRLKITGSCNKSCFFCHGEGDMVNILDFKCDDAFKQCMTDMRDELDMNVALVTGGEPTLNKEFKGLCCWLDENGFQVDMTSNGSIIRDWEEIPLNKATISIHSIFPERIIAIDTRDVPLTWGKKMIENAQENILKLNKAGIDVRVNKVAVEDDLLDEIEGINNLEGDFELRILNNLNRLEASQNAIKKLIKDTVYLYLYSMVITFLRWCSDLTLRYCR